MAENRVIHLVNTTSPKPYDEFKSIPTDGFPEPIVSNLFRAVNELRLTYTRFEARYISLAEEGSSNLRNAMEDLRKLESFEAFYLELEDDHLETDFKSFIIFAKGVLDRLAPFYDHKFGTNLGHFGKSGKSMLNDLKNRKRISESIPLSEVIEHAKAAWIDRLIRMRDVYVHYSTIREYESFWSHITEENRNTISDMQDMHPPVLRHAENDTVLVIDYLQATYQSIIQFCQFFLWHCRPGT